MRSEGRTLGIVLLASLASGCSFTQDNSEPERTLLLKSLAQGDCPSLKDSWESFDENLINAEDFQQVALCNFKKVEDAFDRIKGARSTGLDRVELAALADPFNKGERRFDTEEVQALLLVKKLLGAGSDERMSKADLLVIRGLIERHLRDWAECLSQKNSWKAVLLVIRDLAPKDSIALEAQHLRGALKLAGRYFSDEEQVDLSAAIPAMAPLLSALRPFLGYAPGPQGIPLGALIRVLPAVDQSYAALDAIPKRSLRSAAELSQRLSLIEEASRTSARLVSQASGFGRNPRWTIGQEHVRALIEAIKRIKVTHGSKSYNFNLRIETPRLSQLLFTSLRTLAGRREGSLTAADFENLLYENIRQASISKYVNRKLSREELRSYAGSSIEADEVTLMERVWEELPAYLRYLVDSGELASFRALANTAYEVRITRALLDGFDNDRDGRLDLRNVQDNSEFRELLRILDRVMASLADKPKTKDKDKKKKLGKVEKESIDEILSTPKATLIFSIFADNLRPASRGDGGINAIELWTLVEALTQFQTIESERKRMADFDWADYWSLFKSYSLLRSQSFRATGLDDPDIFSCTLSALVAAPDGATFVASLRECGDPFGPQDASEGDQFLGLHQSHLRRQAHVMPPDKRLSRDQLMLTHLLMSWVEGIASSQDLGQCAREPLPLPEEAEDEPYFPDLSELDMSTCPQALSEEAFAAIASGSIGPGSLRLVPGKLRALLLASEVPPEKILSALLFKAPQILDAVRSSDQASLVRVFTSQVTNNGVQPADSGPALTLPELLVRAEALALALTELKTDQDQP
jgi:hypothetical protein